VIRQARRQAPVARPANRGGELEAIAAKLASALTDYGPRRLGVYHRDGNSFVAQLVFEL
jgi:hypothetical protein